MTPLSQTIPTHCHRQTVCLRRGLAAVGRFEWTASWVPSSMVCTALDETRRTGIFRAVVVVVVAVVVAVSDEK